jgi:HEXXH motif-containing protein
MNAMPSSSPGSIPLNWLALTEVRDTAHNHYTNRLQRSVPRVTRRIGTLTDPDTARLLDAWRDVFLALPVHIAESAVAHPYFNYYWLQLLRACLRGDRTFLRDWAHHLGRFLLIPACRLGVPIPAPLTVAADESDLRIPGHPTHLTFGVQPRPLSVFIDDGGDGVIRNGRVRVPMSFLDSGSCDCETALASTTRITRPVIGGTSIELDGSDPWIARLLESMNYRPAQQGYPKLDMEPVTETSAEQQDNLAAAFAVIERVWPEIASEIRAYVVLFAPFSSTIISSFTEAALMGAVFMSEAMWPFSSVHYTAEHLLHEAAHLRLTLIREIDPLLTPVEDTTYVVPWRRDPRPLSGLLQAIFAFARMAVFHRRAYEVTGNSVHDRRHAETVAMLAKGIDEVEAGPATVFTPAGDQLWGEMRAEAQR